MDRLFDFGLNFVGSITYLAYGSAQGNTRKGLLYGVNEVCQFADFSHLLIILDYFLEVRISDKSDESDSESLKLDAWPLFHPTPHSLRCLTD